MSEWYLRICTSNNVWNRPFPSSLVPLFQSESKRKIILMKITLICMKMKLHAKLMLWVLRTHFRKMAYSLMLRFLQASLDLSCADLCLSTSSKQISNFWFNLFQVCQKELGSCCWSTRSVSHECYRCICANLLLPWLQANRSGKHFKALTGQL